MTNTELQVKHTPAPWTMGNENNQCCDVVLGIEHNLTCSLDRQDANTGDFVITRDEMLANAHLIAAAPELLEALQMSVSAFDGDAIDEIEANYGLGTAQRVHAARSAISKALGEQA